MLAFANVTINWRPFICYILCIKFQLSSCNCYKIWLIYAVVNTFAEVIIWLAELCLCPALCLSNLYKIAMHWHLLTIVLDFNLIWWRIAWYEDLRLAKDTTTFMLLKPVTWISDKLFHKNLKILWLPLILNWLSGGKCC